jgi:hypothetical protein
VRLLKQDCTAPPKRQAAPIVEMVQAGEIIIAFALGEQTAAVLSLLKKYADRGMDLADACIVRMTELIRDSGDYGRSSRLLRL